MITAREVLAATADILGNINVPAVLTNEVAIPIATARGNIIEVIKAMDRDAEAMKAMQQDKEPEEKAEEVEADVQSEPGHDGD